jgi:hypothetical protein
MLGDRTRYTPVVNSRKGNSGETRVLVAIVNTASKLRPKLNHTSHPLKNVATMSKELTIMHSFCFFACRDF